MSHKISQFLIVLRDYKFNYIDVIFVTYLLLLFFIFTYRYMPKEGKNYPTTNQKENINKSINTD